MSYIVVDVESDGPIIGEHSMVCFGAVLFDEKLETTFYGECRPKADSTFVPRALAVSGFSREETMEFELPEVTMKAFAEWLKEHSKGAPILLSDNNGYDAPWINNYFLRYYGSNPFGWSSRRIGDLFAGHKNSMYFRWKRYRKTKHDHNPKNDCLGNCEALQWLKNDGFNIKF